MRKDLMHEPITLTMTALGWMAVHGNVCLGLRASRNRGLSRLLAESFLTQIEAEFLACGLMTEADIDLIYRTEQEETDALQDRLVR